MLSFLNVAYAVRQEGFSCCEAFTNSSYDSVAQMGTFISFSSWNRPSKERVQDHGIFKIDRKIFSCPCFHPHFDRITLHSPHPSVGQHHVKKPWLLTALKKLKLLVLLKGYFITFLWFFLLYRSYYGEWLEKRLHLGINLYNKSEHLNGADVNSNNLLRKHNSQQKNLVLLLWPQWNSSKLKYYDMLQT